jgi:phage terminase small subunit
MATRKAPKKTAPAKKPARKPAPAKKATRKTAPAKKAAPKKTKRGSSTAERRAHNPDVGGSTPPPATTTTQDLLKAKAAIAPDANLTHEQELFVTEFMRNGQNGTAAYMAVHPNVTPGTAAVSAHRWLRNVKVSERIATERARLAAAHEMDRDALLAELVLIVRADTNELMQMRAVCCGSCWLTPEGATKTDADIELDADLPVWMEPNPECTHCQGEGIPRPWFADTRKLSQAARALFAGVATTKEGIKLLTHSKLDAMEKIAKILGAYEKDNEQKAKPFAEAVGEFLGQLRQTGAGRLSPVVAAPRQVKGPDA